MTDHMDEARKLLRKACFLFPRHYKETEAEIAAALSAAKESGRLEAEEKMAELLKNPAAVRVNYLRGNIALKPMLAEEYERGRDEERERCAKVAESMRPNLDGIHDPYEREGRRWAMGSIAEAIRNQP